MVVVEANQQIKFDLPINSECQVLGWDKAAIKATIKTLKIMCLENYNPIANPSSILSKDKIFPPQD